MGFLSIYQSNPGHALVVGKYLEARCESPEGVRIIGWAAPEELAEIERFMKAQPGWYGLVVRDMREVIVN